MDNIVWQPMPRKIREQYYIGGRGSLYASVENVRLAGDDQTMTVTVDAMVTPTQTVLSFYRYDDQNPMNDFQITFSHPTDGIAAGQALVAETFRDKRFVSLRYLKANDFIDWLDA